MIDMALALPICDFTLLEVFEIVSRPVCFIFDTALSNPTADALAVCDATRVALLICRFIEFTPILFYVEISNEKYNTKYISDQMGL